MLDATVCGWGWGDIDAVLIGWSDSTTDFCMVRQQQAGRSAEVGFPHGVCARYYIYICNIVSIVGMFVALRFYKTSYFYGFIVIC